MPKAHATYKGNIAQFRGLSRAVADRRRLALTMIVATPLFLVPFLALAATMPWIAAGWMLLVLGPLAFTLLRPSRVDVGPEGVMLSWMGRKRFIPFGDVVGAHSYAKRLDRDRVVGAAILLKGGERINVPVGAERETERAEALAQCILDKLLDYERGDVGDIDGVASLLQQGDRDVPEWFQSLRVLGEGANVTLRDAPVNPEGLWRIVLNQASPVRDRVAATVALRASLTDEGQKRLRVAASATMDPQLRVAIDLAANGDDDAQLEAALHEASARK